jgi:replicative DNA helicase
MFSSTGGILAASLRDGNLTDGDMTKIVAAAGKLAAAPIQFRDDVFDLADMLSAIKQYKLAYPDLFAFFVDYAQLIGAEIGHGQNREQEVAKISTALRRITMQEKLCCVVLSQLNDDGKLRESRRIGMDATVIAIIEDEEDEPKVKRVKLIQRGGRKCTVRLAYRGDFMRFDSLPDGESYPQNEDPEEKTQTKKKPWKQ